MTNYVVTYNIINDEIRNDFESILEELGLEKQTTNQSTYYGYHNGNLKVNIFTKVNSLKFENNDTITIYFPKATNSKADIGKFELKEEGKKILKQP